MSSQTQWQCKHCGKIVNYTSQPTPRSTHGSCPENPSKNHVWIKIS